jgi:phenylalanyl-tRNA synthetase beta chain
MYISRDWLKDFVKIPDSLSAKELGLKLTMAMAEIEGWVDHKKGLKDVVVGELLEIKKHPNADKLSVAKIDVGEKKPRQIIFGQLVKMKVGDKIPVALAPTTLPMNIEIKKAKLRGEMSEGMLCLDQELGLSKEGVTLQYFDKVVKNGTKIAQALKLDDIVYEIDNKSLTHRPDLWSHYGVAREVAAILGNKLESYKVKSFKDGKEKLDIKINDYQLCSRYMGVVIEGIIIEASPDWLKKRIEAIGMRSINNIVDITNYVMTEIGQPLHAFDYDKLEGHRIVVRKAKPGEKIKTLDDENRKLDESMLVIADAQKPVAIAGVMGGADTEINNKTQKIIIESANFDHVSARKTSQKLGLRTEASIRFEKSLDPNIAELGIKKAIELILQVCPEAKLVSKIEDVKKFKLDQGPINVSFDLINKRIGQVIEPKKIISILENLGFAVKKQKEGIEVIVPTWRATKDVSIPEDIIEEVARIYGYDNLEIRMPAVSMDRPQVNKARELERKIKNLLAYGFDLTEVYNYSFNSEEQLNKIGLEIDTHIKVANPLTSETTMMRTSLIPNLLSNISQNEKFFDDIKLFECGSVYLKSEPGKKISEKGSARLPLQEKYFAGVICDKDDKTPFYTAKNIIEAVFKQLRLNYKLEEAKIVPVWAVAKRGLNILLNKKTIGRINELKSQIADKFDIKNQVSVFEFNFNDLVNDYNDNLLYRPIPKFPSVELDISMIIDKKVLWSEVKDLVKSVDKELIRQVSIFDVYEGKNVPANKKSIAFRITYRSDAKTLTMEEVQVIHNKVLKLLINKLGGEIRK